MTQTMKNNKIIIMPFNLKWYRHSLYIARATTPTELPQVADAQLRRKLPYSAYVQL